MFVTAVLAMLCTAGIGFYVRFLVALCKECKPRRVGYWVRLRLDFAEGTIGEPQGREILETRAA